MWSVTWNSFMIGKPATCYLYDTVDGRGLRNHGSVPSIHSWVSDGTRILTAAKYIGAIQVRCNSLYTKGTAARGRPSRDTRCTTCREFESLGHVLQTCAKTWSMRNDRHDTLVKETVKVLERKVSGHGRTSNPNLGWGQKT